MKAQGEGGALSLGVTNSVSTESSNPSKMVSIKHTHFKVTFPPTEVKNESEHYSE